MKQLLWLFFGQQFLKYYMQYIKDMVCVPPIYNNTTWILQNVKSEAVM